MPLWVHGVNVSKRRLIVSKYLYQTAALQIFADVPFGAHRNAVAVQHPVDGYLAVVGAQATTHFYTFCAVR